jgi:hypothetical protein
MFRPHKESRWILRLAPGPKARAEFAVAHGRKVSKQIERTIAGMDLTTDSMLVLTARAVIFTLIMVRSGHVMVW